MLSPDVTSEFSSQHMTPVFKKGDATECSNYRTIAQIFHASKTMLKVMQERLLPYMEQEMLNVQAGFRKGRVTQDLIVNFHRMLECSKELHKKVSLCFIYYTVKPLTAWKTMGCSESNGCASTLIHIGA